MQLRRAERDRERAESAAWRDRAAQVLGPILGVLHDMEPRAVSEDGGRSRQTIENIGRRWWRARDDLFVFGVANPSQQIATASQALADAVARSWVSMTSLNRTLEAKAPVADRERLLERAARDHEQATSLARQLEELSRAGPKQMELSSGS